MFFFFPRQDASSIYSSIYAYISQKEDRVPLFSSSGFIIIIVWGRQILSVPYPHALSSDRFRHARLTSKTKHWHLLPKGFSSCQRPLCCKCKGMNAPWEQPSANDWQALMEKYLNALVSCVYPALPSELCSIFTILLPSLVAFFLPGPAYHSPPCSCPLRSLPNKVQSLYNIGLRVEFSRNSDGSLPLPHYIYDDDSKGVHHHVLWSYCLYMSLFVHY